MDIAAAIVAQFEAIHRDRMHGLPVVNDRLAVELIGLREVDDHRLGVLLTPWFMNLLLLPGDDGWSDLEQGARVNIDYPSGPVEYLVTHDEELGTYLTAVLFGSVTDFSDQATARAVARETLRRLFEAPERDAGSDDGRRRMSRRSLFGLGRG